MTFSQRMGLVTPKVIQLNSMDVELKNSLYNFIYVYIIEERVINFYQFNKKMTIDYYKYPLYFYDNNNDYFPSHPIEEFEANFLQKNTWNQIYDLIEILLTEEDVLDKCNLELLLKELNKILERENSAYRYIGGKFVPITNEIEIASIDEALKSTNKLCTEHLQRALELLSDKENPDYRNSIKESISAVECLVKSFTDKGKGTLSALLGEMKKEDKIHASLSEGLSKIYGYTSNESGIRHALTEEGRDVTKDEAMFMLVSCSAFINYLQAKNNVG